MLQYQIFVRIVYREKLILKLILIYHFHIVTKDALRGLMVCPTLMAVSQFSGTFTLTNYAATIFKESGSTINPNYSSVVLGCFQVIGTCISIVLIDRLGRKKLLMFSTIAAAACLLITGTYSYYIKQGFDLSNFNMVPVVTLSVYICVSAVGIIPIPYVLVSEVFPQKVMHYIQIILFLSRNHAI